MICPHCGRDVPPGIHGEPGPEIEVPETEVKFVARDKAQAVFDAIGDYRRRNGGPDALA